MHLRRWSPNRALEQISYLLLQDPVGRQPDHVPHTRGYEELVDLRIGKGRVAAKIAPLHRAPEARDYRLQHRASAVGTMDVTRPQCAPLQITKLVARE
jgi:hypothetical protein